MVKKHLNIKIDKNGQVQIDVQGAQGSECTKMTHALEEALGGHIIHRELKDSYFNTDNTTEETSLESS